MQFYTEWRLTGDTYFDSYSNGLTLIGGSSVSSMKTVSETPDETVFEGEKGHILRCLHRHTDNVTRCQTIFENPTDETASLELLSSFAIKGLQADRIHRAASFWSAEGKLISQDLTELDMEPSWAHHGLRIEKFGQAGSMPVRKWFPFLVLEDSKNSRFLGIQLYCASSWQIEVFRRDETISVQGGIADRDFGSWTKKILPGTSFTTPAAVIAEGDSLYEVCDRLVKAQTPRIAPADSDMPVIFNEYCTTWGNPSIENLTATAKRLQGSGVRFLVIDCGWYRSASDGNWFEEAGDWVPSKELFPNGIKEAADMIRDHGLIPGIWFELENAGARSEAFHKTDMLLSRDGYPVTVGSRRFWDMRQPAVWDYLDEHVLKLLKENGFGYLKIDYNETIGAGVDGAESPGEGLRQTVEMSRSYIRHLSEELPELVIENGASGGHRLEPSMMELVSQASFSDAHECTAIPLIAANLQRLIRPEQCQIWAVLRADADEKRLKFVLTSALLGRLCLSGEIFDLSEEQWDVVKEAISFYAKVRHIIKDGRTTLIRSDVKDYSDPAGHQEVLRVLGDEALLIEHTFRDGAGTHDADLLQGYTITDSFGSGTGSDFSGQAYLLSRRNE